MSAFRPHPISPAMIWLGRAAAVTGLFFGLENVVANTALFGLGGAVWPLMMGVAASAALWINTEKAAQINRDDRAYTHATDRALKEGKTEAHLPTRFLDRAKQVSGLVTGYGALASGVGLLMGTIMLLTSTATLIVGVGSTVGLGAFALEGAALFAAGIAGWEVTKSADAARHFAYSSEAEAERKRIGKEIAGAAMHVAPPPQVAVIPTAHATPFTDRLHREQEAELARAEIFGKHSANLADSRQLETVAAR